MKTLSVTIICKNEEQNLARLLPQLDFADQIVVVDTGSCDNSVKIALQYTQSVYYYKWRDDFAKARNYAVTKAKCGYVMWLDCDDELSDETKSVIIKWLKDDLQNQDFVYLKYRMGLSSQFWFWRERIVRRCKQCRFKGFIHEAISPFGNTHYLDCDIVHTSLSDHSERNLAIYRKALEQGRRFSLRDKYYYARTLTENGLYAEAEPVLKKICKNPKAYIADRLGSCKLLAKSFIKQAKYNSALHFLALSTALLPPDSEICCLFGDAYYFIKNYVYACRWYELAVQSRVQVGFVNDYYKRLYPYIQLSVCCWRQGDYKQAKFYHKLAKACDPLNAAVLNNDKWF